MKLDTWRKNKGHSYRGLAKLLNVSGATVVRRWCLPMSHADYRIPSFDHMKRILELTQGAVQPNDFYIERN